MARDYRAFISYRHAEVDSRVAAEVQRALERFHVPLPIRKQTGMKNLAPVFRDKEELPVTSELSKDISDALANSSNLIVICSPRTAESSWVQREIDTFMQTHNPDDVLTVLAEGEPGDVIPPVLLQRTQKVTLEDGTEQEVVVPVEPLSCDFRSARKADHRPEVTRLAAAMLRVPYDSLVRRQQRYRRRIALAAAALALGVIAYGAWSLVQINDGLIATQRSQSTILARNAMQSFEQGDTLQAIELALAALPGAGGDRPVVAEAEYALERISSAYVPAQTETGNLRTNAIDYGPVRSLLAGRDIAHIASTPEGAYVAASSFMNRAICWNAETGACTYRRDVDNSVPEIAMSADGRLVIAYCGIGSDSVSCIRAEDGKELWNASFSSDDDRLSKARKVAIDEDAKRVIVLCDAGARILDLDKGTVISTAPISSFEGMAYYFKSDLYATDGASFAIPWQPDSQTQEFAVVLGDLKTGESCMSHDRFDSITATEPIGKGRILVSSSSPLNEVGESSTYSVNHRRSTVTAPYQQKISCLDATSGATTWSTAINLWQPIENVIMFEAPLELDDGKTHSVIIWCGANVCAWLDASSGKLLGSLETSAAFVSAWLGADSTIEGCLMNGEFALCTPKRRLSVSQQIYPTGTIAGITTGKGEFIAADETVYLYAPGLADASWVQLSDAGYMQDSIVDCNGTCACIDLYGDDHEGKPTTTMYDPETGDELWSATLAEDNDDRSMRYLGYVAEMSALVFQDSRQDGAELILVSATDGSIAREPTIGAATGLENQRSVVASLGTASIVGKAIYSEVSATDGQEGSSLGHYVAVTDLETFESTLYETDITALPLLPDNSTGKVLLGTNWVSDDVSGLNRITCRVFDANDGSFWDIDTPIIMLSGVSVTATWGEDGSLYVLCDDGIRGYNADGSIRFTQDIGNATVLGMNVFRGELRVLLFDDDYARLERMDPRNGSIVHSARIAIDRGKASYAARLATWSELGELSPNENGQYVLQLGEIAYILDEDGMVHQEIETLGYDSASDIFLVQRAGDDVLGAFKRYSVDELIKRGEELLGDSRMSDNRRAEYGL